MNDLLNSTNRNKIMQSVACNGRSTAMEMWRTLDFVVPYLLPAAVQKFRQAYMSEIKDMTEEALITTCSTKTKR